MTIEVPERFWRLWLETIQVTHIPDLNVMVLPREDQAADDQDFYVVDAEGEPVLKVWDHMPPAFADLVVDILNVVLGACEDEITSRAARSHHPSQDDEAR